MKVLVTFLAILTACGQAPTDGLPTDQNAAPTETTKTQGTTTETDDFQSFYLDTKAELWPCVPAIYRQLVYIQEETQFYTCVKNDWVMVSIKGEKGDKGEDGKQGEDGEDGQDGVNGKDGAQGKQGDNGRTIVQQSPSDEAAAPAHELMDNEWIEPIAGVLWFTGATYHRGQIPDLTEGLCPAGSRSPSDTELAQAGRAGLFDRFSGATSFAWIGMTDAKAGRLVQLNLISGLQGKLTIAGTGTTANPTYYKTLCVALD